MSWFRNIIERKAPTWAGPIGYTWCLFQCRWFGFALVLRHRSDSTFDQRAEAHRIRLVLEGEYLDHYEIPRIGEYEPAGRLPKKAYVYGNRYGLWASLMREPGDLFYEPLNRRGGTELLDARNTEERIVDYPEWMEHKDVVFNSDRQVVMLTLTWGGVWAS